VDSIESFSGDAEPPAGSPLRAEPASLLDLRSGFRDEHQRRVVQLLIRDRIADDRVQDECRYLLRFCWQLAMTYTEVTMPELRARLTDPRLAVVTDLIWAIRQSADEIDNWIRAVEGAWPVIQDRTYQGQEADAELAGYGAHGPADLRSRMPGDTERP
jgi:hypothetical protein